MAPFCSAPVVYFYSALDTLLDVREISGNLLAESLEMIQQTASVILAAPEPSIADDVITEELEEVAA